MMGLLVGGIVFGHDCVGAGFKGTLDAAESAIGIPDYTRCVGGLSES